MGQDKASPSRDARGEAVKDLAEIKLEGPPL